jgi:hypothetical protein
MVRRSVKVLEGRLESDEEDEEEASPLSAGFD